MKVDGIHRICLVRQVNEAVRIMISEAGRVMNSKSEFHQALLVRVVPTSGPGPGPPPRRRGRGRGGRAGRSRGRGTS